MIVRCKSCVSAFAVDDDKVANRKFAFTCPKCGTENIFDNRGPAVAVKTAEFDDFHEEDIFDDMPEETASASGRGRKQEAEDIFAEEHAPEKTVEDEFAAFDDEFMEEPAPEKAGRKLNLDIEEAPAEAAENDFSFSDDDILFDEAEPAAKKAAVKSGAAGDEDLFAEDAGFEAAAESTGEAHEVDLNEPDFTSIDLDSELAGIDLDVPVKGVQRKAEKPAKAAAPADDELIADLDVDFNEIPSEEPQPEKTDRDKKLTSQNDIDALFAEASSQGGTSAEDDINIDLDSLDIEFEENPEEKKAEPRAAGKEPEDEMVFFDEEPAPAARKEKDEVTLDFDTSDLLEEPEQKKPGREAKAEPAEDDITIDIDSLDIEIEEPEKKPAGKGKASDDELAFDIDEMDIEPAGQAEKPSVKKKPADDELAFDIDTMDIEMEELKAEAPEGKESEIEDLSLDLDSLDIELEKADSSGAGDDVLFGEDEIAIDMDSLEFEAEPGVSGKTAQKPAAAKKQAAETADEDITLDIDSLDIDIEEPVSPAVKALPEKKQAPADTDESITLDIDSLDIELEEPAFDHEPSAEQFADEEIEIDMDSLDFDDIEEQPEPARRKNVRDIVREQAGGDDEEDIKLNLDELDIDIDEIQEKDLDFVKPAAKSSAPRKGIIEEAPEDEDESITIDLDTLDIEVAESPEAAGAELSEEDEKLTLDDAGMTFDELTAEEKPAKKKKIDLAEDEEIRLTLDEFDTETQLEQIGEIASPDEPLLRESMEELPEIELDEMETPETPLRGRQKHAAESEYSQDDDIIFPEEELELDIELEPAGTSGAVSRYNEEMETGSYSESTYRSRGSASFSVDYSLKYSRLGAFLRLIQLYTLSMIPHFIVMFIYTMLSGILGFINQLVILSTGRSMEDFTQITENTLRYYLYIQTCITGIVEDRPVYAGRDKIDHQMQLNLTYPLKYSKLLAACRLSMIGIFLITLPHIIILMFITLIVPAVYLVGIIAVIIMARWPNPLFLFLTVYFRYMARISAFMTGITDEYPSFRLI